MGTLRTALVGQTGILSIKHGGEQVSRYRPDLGDTVIDISSAEKTNTTGKFSTINGGKLESCLVDFEPIQDLHGYNNPWFGGGKNLIPMTVDTVKSINTAGTWSGNTYSLRGCEVTINTDDDGNIVSFTVNRVDTSTSNLVFYLARDLVIAQESILNGCPSGGSDSTYRIRTNDSDYDYGSGVTVQPKTTGIYIRVEASYDIQNVTFYPMLRKATVTDASFEPYTNICGITGHSSVEVTVSDAEDTVIEDVTVALGDTYYGGTLDVVSGTLTIDKGFYVFNGTENWSTTGTVFRLNINNDYKKADYINGITNLYPMTAEVTTASNVPSMSASFLNSQDYSRIMVNDSTYADVTEFETALSQNNLQVAYDLAAPTVIQLTPQQINALIGENNIDTPLDGQSLTSVIYRDMFSWSDIEDVVEEVDAKNADISSIGTDESGRTTASKAYAVGEHFYKDGKFCTAIASIASGATFTLNTNYVEGNIADYFNVTDSNITVPTGITYISISQSSVERCGNAVSVQGKFTVTDMPTISSATTIIKVPYKMVGRLKMGLLVNSETLETLVIWVNTNSTDARVNYTIPNGTYYFSMDYITNEPI